MRKICKRTLAIVLTLCALLGLMIPAAFADTETPAAFYDFDLGVHDSHKTSVGDKSLTGYTDSSKQTSIRKYLESQYDSLNWKVKTWFGGYDGTSMFETTLGRGLRLKTTNSGQGVAFTIKAPKAGYYRFNLNRGVAFGGKTDIVEVYMLPTDIADTSIPDYLDAQKYPDYYVGEFSTYYNSTEDKAKIDLGEYYLDGRSEYFLAFKQTGTSRIYLRDLSLYLVEKTEEAKLNDGTATTLEAALAAASSGDTVNLVSHVALPEAGVTITNGVTLNLNGYTLSGAVKGGTITDSTDGAGRVFNSVAPTCAVKDGEMLLNDNGSWRVFKYSIAEAAGESVEKAADGKSVNFWFDVRFNNADAYRVIALGESDFSVSATFTVNGVSKDASFSGGFSAADWAEKMVEKAEYSFYIKVTGIDTVTEGTLIVAPAVGGKTGSGSVTMPAFDLSA
jgi:hypothetical protein